MDETGLTFHQAITKACQDRLRPILLTAITTIVGLLPLLDEFVHWFFTNDVSAWILPHLNYVLAWFSPKLQILYSGGNMENYGLQDTLKMFSSLSRSTVGGMLTATLSTLFVIPVLYAIFYRLKQWLHWRINEVFHTATQSSQPALAQKTAT